LRAAGRGCRPKTRTTSRFALPQAALAAHGTWIAPVSLDRNFFAGGDMGNSIDNFLGVHAQALAVESRRTQLLASNLANADTPNFKARDIDFRAALAAATAPGAGGPGTAGGLQMTAASSGNSFGGTAANGAQDPTLLYRTPLAPALDGNTVDPQLEQAAFAENAVRYQATLTLLNGKFRALMTAITGQ
jgi:flagellar basal-body rod protein FlgB